MFTWLDPLGSIVQISELPSKQTNAILPFAPGNASERTAEPPTTAKIAKSPQMNRTLMLPVPPS
jgi:hypothetical protein